MNAPARIRICLVFGSWILVRIRIGEMQKLSRLKMQPWKAMDTQNGGVEVHKGGLEGSLDHWSQIRITLMRSRIWIWIQIDIEVNSWIRISI
jgi:hypothetical protein